MSEMQENYTPEQNDNTQIEGAFEFQSSIPPMGVFNRENEIKYQEKREIKRCSNAASISLILVSLLSFAVGLFFYSILAVMFGQSSFEILESPAVNETLQILFSIISFTLPFVLVFKGFGYRISDLVSFSKPQKGLAIPLFFFGTAVSFFSNVGSNVIDTIFSGAGIDYSVPQLSKPQGFFGFVLVLLSTAIVPALVEEFAFRGVILGSLRRYGDRFALIVSSVLFGLVHSNFSQIPFAFFMGLIMGFTVLKTNSLRTAMCIHFYNNILSVIFTSLPQTIPQDIQNLLYLLVVAVSVLFGFLSLGSKKTKDIFTLDNKTQNLETGERKSYKYYFTSIGFVIFAGICLAESVYYIFI